MKSSYLTAVFGILISLQAWSKDYYVSSSTGNDARTPTEATNASTPWKSISKVNSFFPNLLPGDRILFKRGETFYGTLKITKSGTSSAPIVIGAYGTGNRPVLTGFVSLSSWTSAGTGIYESYNASLSTELNMVLWNGKVQQIGRYPNANATNKGYLVLEAAGSTSITDNQLTGSWTGGEVVVRSSHWTIDRRKITSHSGTTINFSSALTYTAKPKFGYFIQGHLKTLDQAGEWYYNPSTKKVYIYTGGSAPSGVKASALNNVVYISKQHYINFSELRFEGGNTETIYINGATNININGCEVHFSGENGIRTTDSKTVKFLNGVVNESNNNALDFRNSVYSATISNNAISNSGTRAGMGLSHNDSYQAIILNGGSHHTIEYNTIKNTGYNGIRFTGDYVTIKNNLIDYFCYVKDDGAGIYTYNSAGTNYVQRKLVDNIILNGPGANEGTDRPDYFPTEGIYMDNNVTNVDIIGNTIANCNKGIYIHNSSYIKMLNNTFYNNTLQFSYSHDAFGNPIRNTVATNNILFSKEKDQTVSSIKSILNDISSMGRLDSNFYCRPLDDRLVIFSSYKNSSGTRIDANHDLPGWQTKYSKDLKSKKSPLEIPEFKLESLVGSSKFANGSFTSNINGLYGSSCSPAWTSVSGMDGGHAQITTSSTASKSSISIPVGSLSSSKSYRLKFSGKGSTNIEFGIYLRQGPSPYTSLSPTQYRKFTTSRNEFEILFSNPTSISSANIMLVVYTPGVKYWIDNVQFHEANVTLTNPDDYIRFEYNPTKSNKSIALSGTYVDVKNKSYSSSVTLAPFTSIVLIKTSAVTATSPTVAAPVVAITSPTANAAFNAPATVRLTANASISGSSITKVEFYHGSTLITTEKTAPYDWSWQNVPAGTYSITAKAYASNGTMTVSAPVSITVSSSTSSTSSSLVTLASPTQNATYKAPANVRLLATTSVTGRTRVEFYNGSTLIMTDNYAPHDWWWKNVPAGTYSLTAKLYAENGSTSVSSPVTIKVLASSSAVVEPDVDSHSESLTFKLYPNPATSTLTLNLSEQLDERVNLAIYTAAGSVVDTQTKNAFGNQISVDVSSLTPGVYTLVLTSKNHTYSKTFAKK